MRVRSFFAPHSFSNFSASKLTVAMAMVLSLSLTLSGAMIAHAHAGQLPDNSSLSSTPAAAAPVPLQCGLPVAAEPAKVGDPLPSLSPRDLLTRSGECMDQKQMGKALVLYHAGMLGLERLIMAGDDQNSSDGNRLTMLAVQDLIEAPLFNWAAGDIPGWIDAIGAALSLVDEFGNKATLAPDAPTQVSAERWQAIQMESRLNLFSLMNELHMKRSSIYLARDARHQEVRDPAWTKKVSQDARKKATLKKPEHSHE